MSGELISICEPSCHGVCIMKWSKSVSFIRVGHFYTVNCLNLVGLPFNIVSANQGPVNYIRRASGRPMTRAMMQLSHSSIMHRIASSIDTTSDLVSRMKIESMRLNCLN